jgi:hypothetical protein
LKRALYSRPSPTLHSFNAVKEKLANEWDSLRQKYRAAQQGWLHIYFEVARLYFSIEFSSRLLTVHSVLLCQCQASQAKAFESTCMRTSPSKDIILAKTFSEFQSTTGLFAVFNP